MKKFNITEEQRYVMTKIFNKNDYNLEIKNEIWGTSK